MKSLSIEMTNPVKRILFFLTHPAHYHLFKISIRSFLKSNYQLQIVITRKDVLEELVREEGWAYTNIFPEGRRNPKLPIILATGVYLCKTETRLSRLIRANRPDLLAGTDGSLAHLGKFFRIPSMLFNEDDSSATPENYIVYPFATKLVLPSCCDPGRWKNKRISYHGYHELAYLHPKHFTADPGIADSLKKGRQKYFVLRLAELTASHDVGKTGISNDTAIRIIRVLEKYGQVYITAERSVAEEFQPYLLPGKPGNIFHVLAGAEMFIGDSQTMAAEAAVLGTPSVRFNDFVGKLGYLEELEHRYGLTFGVPTSEPERLFAKMGELLRTDQLKQIWQDKRRKLLEETIEVSSFFTKVIEDQLKSDR